MPRAHASTRTGAKLRRCCIETPNRRSAARCAGDGYPLFDSQPYPGCLRERETIGPSRTTFARIDAAATHR